MKKKHILLLVLVWYSSVIYAEDLNVNQQPRRNWQENQVREKTGTFQIQSLTYTQALKKIAQAFDVGLAVNSSLVPEGRVDLYLEAVTLEKALDLLLEGTGIGAFVSPEGNIMLRKGSDEQEEKKYSIKGKITNGAGEPLPGASIIIKGTTNGTTSDNEGNFVLANIPGNSILVFSFIGMKSQESLVNQDNPNLTVVLHEENVSLNEVVAVGYGSARKKDLTSSITTVNAKDLNKGIVADPILRLQGKVPGLTMTKDGDPNGGYSIFLRGPSTLRTGSAQQPFFVIDGVPGGIMPAADDIVSIDILRDASATAIYGSRAANGVIIVTTKKGESKSKISYNSYVAVEQVSNKIDMLSANEYRIFLADNGLNLDPIDEDNANIDWMKEVTRTGISHNNNVSISGESNKTSYFSSIDYLKNQGIILGSGFDRLTLRASIEQRAINDKLKLVFSVTNLISNSETVPNDVYLGMWNYIPTINIQDEDGTYKENLDHGGFNPVALIKQNTNESKNKDFLGTVHAQLNILKGLDFDFRASYQNGQTNQGIYYSKGSAIAQGLNGEAIRSSYESEKKIMESFLSYEKSFQEHNLKLLGGYSWQEESSGDGFQTNSTNFVSDETSYYNLGLGSNYDGFSPDYGSTSISTLRMISFYSRLNYSYKGRYLLQATIRRDGSSAFGENNQWGYFPSVSAGWRITEEPFLKDQKIFGNLKLRIGYGESGNSLGFDPLISRVRYGSTGKFYYNGGFINGIGPTQNDNPDLKWERTNMLNIGLDFSILNERLSGTIEYYDKMTNDLIWNYAVSTSQYYVNTLTANAGQIENEGFEVSLNATPVRTGSFSWNTSLNLSFNRNNINSLSNDKFQLEYVHTGSIGDHGQSGNYAQIIEEDYPIGQFYLWKYAGKNEDGVSQFYAADGSLTVNPSSDDHFYAGSAQPKATGGWQNTFTYKNFSLDFLFRGVTGNKILNATLANLNYPAEATHFNMPEMTLDESVNDDRAHYVSTRYVEKGDYLRLDNVTFAYTFQLTNPFIKTLRLYTTVNNAFIITKYKGIDPEVNMGGLTPGIDNDNYYPKTRSFILGINLDL